MAASENSTNEAPLGPASGPSFPGVPHPEDVGMAKLEVCYKPTLFCTLVPPGICDEPSPTPDRVVGAAAAAVATEFLWKGRQILSVWFTNPEDLTKWNWRYKGEEITIEKILDWANVWNPDNDDRIPTFEPATKENKADIRIKLSDTEGCWSVVGMLADKVKRGKPTMVLNLGGQYHEEDKRSLVIHEFGHALGLEHEHQRPDFWDGVEKHIDIETMKDDERVKDPIYSVGVASFGAGWFENKETFFSTLRKVFRITKDPKTVMTQYDSQSIMHYGFDYHWLKKDSKHNLHSLRAILDDDELSDAEKEFLKGIHDRHGGLAPEPSPLDLEALKRAYHGQISAIEQLHKDS